MRLAEGLCHPDKGYHGVVGGPDDAGRQEQALNIVALVKRQGQVDDFLNREAGAPDVGGATVDAVGAVVDAGVGEQDLQQRDAAAIRRVGVADSVAGAGPDAAAIP